jgi:hypothetical protein
LINPKDVFFPKAMDIIPVEFHNSDGYIWLKDFKENEYKKLNAKRRQFVHYTNENTNFKHGHLKSFMDFDKMKSLQEERLNLTIFYKMQLEKSLQGFKYTMLLIEKINELYLSEIE